MQRPCKQYSLRAWWGPMMLWMAVFTAEDAMSEASRSGYKRWDLAFHHMAFPLLVQQLQSSGVGDPHVGE